ncbi:MAG: PaaI family thioesterase [Beutenbergiaceae bacterium]
MTEHTQAASAFGPFKNAGPLAERLGIKFVELGPQRCVATMPVAGNTQPAGLLHGGASVVLAETVGSIAATLYAGPGRIAVGIEINASHHRSVREGMVTATADAISQGSTSASYEIVIADDAGRRVCTSRLTCRLVEPR